MAECHPSKVDVAGSNPVSRSDDRGRTTELDSEFFRRRSSVLRRLWACSSMAEQRPHTPVCPAGEILVVQVVKFGGTWTNDRVVIPSQA